MGVWSETQHGEHCATGLELIYRRMPEVEKQTSSVQEVRAWRSLGDWLSRFCWKMPSPRMLPSWNVLLRRHHLWRISRRDSKTPSLGGSPWKPLLWRSLLWRRRRERRCEQRRRASVTPPRKRRRLQELRSRPLNKLLRLFHNVVMLRKLA